MSTKRAAAKDLRVIRRKEFLDQRPYEAIQALNREIELGLKIDSIVSIVHTSYDERPYIVVYFID
jgi:hypothetical protein